jgi:hypothetical protein
MQLIWRLLPGVCALGAGIQAYAVTGRITHFATIAWKTGLDTVGVIDAGRTMIWAFFALTALVIVVAEIVEKRCRKESAILVYICRMSSTALWGGALIWTAMLMSPFVIISPR